MRHCFFMKQLIAAGVEPKIAEADACRLEHVISSESFEWFVLSSRPIGIESHEIRFTAQ